LSFFENPTAHQVGVVLWVAAGLVSLSIAPLGVAGLAGSPAARRNTIFMVSVSVALALAGAVIWFFGTVGFFVSALLLVPEVVWLIWLMRKNGEAITKPRLRRKQRHQE